MRKTTIILAVTTAVLLAGLVVVNSFEASREAYDLVRFHARSELGLPKKWEQLPTAARAADRAKTRCPDPDVAIVMLAGGQSNAANSVNRKHAAEASAYEWFEGACYKLADPLLGATSTGGSIWSLYADRLAQQSGRPVLVIAAAVGGTQFSDWNDPRSGYLDALKRRHQSARKAGYAVDAIFWHQGETDAAVESDMAAFSGEAATLLRSVLAEIPSAPLYLFQASRCTGPRRKSGVPAIVAALRAQKALSARIVIGMNTDELGDEYRYDACHFNRRGREAIVETLLKAGPTLGLPGAPDPA